jgi:uncharacterized protein (DUF362 family)
MTVSLHEDSLLKYPSGEDYFSPGTQFPEYGMKHLAKSENSVYRAVRLCLANAGLDSANYETEHWNPLGTFIAPGDNVFLLCNFVQEQVGRGGDETFFAKCTHGSVIRAMIDYVLIALKGQGRVRFGNAPLQACSWEDVIIQTGAARVREFYAKVNQSPVNVDLVDLRKHVVRQTRFGGMKTEKHEDFEGDQISVDLGVDSLLEGHYENAKNPKFRVLDYDHRRTEGCHSTGKHIYYVSKEIMDSDVVVSIPKLKTHEKVGMTCGIKGCVGAVAHKDCLAHHRFGPPSDGGDEYPERFGFLKIASSLHDKVNLRGQGIFSQVMAFIDTYSRKILRRFTRSFGGSWSGNDTCWRMALDIARIVEYSDKSGVLRNTKQRKHLVMTDGIVAGEAEGPLSPRPVSLGFLGFSDNVGLGDVFNAIAMGFDPLKIRYLKEMMEGRAYPLLEGDIDHCSVRINGTRSSFKDAALRFKRKFVPPSGWKGWL